jgi:hypothetical protein
MRPATLRPTILLPVIALTALCSWVSLAVATEPAERT